MSKQKKYDLNLLKEVIERDEILIDFEKLKKISSIDYIDFICKCGNPGNKTFRLMFEKGSLCRYCTIELYNIRHKESLKKNTGFEYALQNKKTLQKKKDTCVERYNVEHATQSNIIKEKTKQTCLKHYGVEYSSQVEEIKEKKKQSYIKSLGVENPMQNEEVKIKSRITCLEKYGFEYSSQDNDIKNKGKNTCLERYGVEYAIQNEEIAEKLLKNSFNLKKYTFPCGKIINTQGYEHFALDELLKEGYTSDDIITSRKEVPEIWWNDSNGKKHRYFIDIYIPKINKMIEVKSTWTFKYKTDEINIKINTCKSLGYNAEIWIYDNKRNKIIV